MKWTKIGKKPERSASPDLLKSYEYYADQKSLDRAFDIDRPGIDKNENQVPNRKQSHLWVAYQFRDYMEPDKQRDYEIFCGGFLLFYDNIVRGEAVDHRLYFEWYPKPKPKKNNGPFYVSIYLSPKPFKVIDRLRQQEQPAPDAMDVKLRELHTQNSEADIAAGALDGSPNDLDSIDPPPPPPPPPPPRG